MKWEANRFQSLNGGLKRCSCLCERRHYPRACKCGSLTEAHGKLNAKPKPQPNRCCDKACDCAGGKKKKEEESITLGVAAAPPSLQRFFINKRCPMAVKGIGHMPLFTIPLQLSAPSTTNERVRTFFPCTKEKCFSLFCLSAFISGLYSRFCAALPSLSPPHPQELQLKSIRSPVLWPASFPGMHNELATQAESVSTVRLGTF